MSSFQPGRYKPVAFSQLLRTSRPRYPKVLYKYIRGEDLIQVAESGITLVLGRMVRKNARIAADISIGIAKQYPDNNVLYLNTYSGEEFLKESFQSASISAGFPLPDEEEELPDPSAVHDSSEPQKAATIEVLPNLHIINSEIGSWNAESLREVAKEAGTHVLVMNSFEFAPVTRSQKEKVARDLIRIKKELDLTLVVFSHEMKRDVEPGLVGRGAIGFLTTYCTSLARLPDEYMVQKRGENGNVHEKQMHRPSSERKIPAWDTDPDRDYYFGDYLENPWLDTSERPGNELYCFARSPRLKEFYKHRFTMSFKKEEVPTEEQLEWMQEGRLRYEVEMAA